MFRSDETNRFVIEELRKEKQQQFDLLVNKLFETSSYSSIDSPKSIRRKFGMWLCKKRVKRSIQDFHNIGLIDFDCRDSGLCILSELATEIFEPAQTTNANFDKLLEWSYVVGDKQYFLYSWNDSKVQGLIAVDGALMAGILFILQLLDGAQNLTLSVSSLVLYAISFVLLACSILFCLGHTIPKLNTEIGKCFISPGIIDITTLKEKPDNELIGPFIKVIRVRNFKEAIDEANNTSYGLAAGIFTEDKALYEKFSFYIKAGLVNWNQQLTGAAGTAPFGGIKKSGNYRPSGYFAVDYCVYAVASMEIEKAKAIAKLPIGIKKE